MIIIIANTANQLLQFTSTITIKYSINSKKIEIAHNIYYVIITKYHQRHDYLY